MKTIIELIHLSVALLFALGIPVLMVVALIKFIAS